MGHPSPGVSSPAFLEADSKTEPKPAAAVIQYPSTPELLELHKKSQDAMFDRVLQDLGQQAAVVLGDTFAFRDIAPDQETPPEEWIDELGAREAVKRLAVARAGWLPPKDAPSGVSVARAFAVGFMKSEAAKKQGARTLNVQVVQMATGDSDVTYERIQVERERK